MIYEMIDLSSEQRMFRDACAGLAAELAARWHPGRGPAEAASPAPDAGAWSAIAEAGWLGLRLQEKNGGAGADAVYAALLTEELARHAVAAPVLGTLIAAEQLQAYGAEPGLLGDIAAGAVRVAPLLEPGLTGFAATAEGALAWDCAGADFAVSVVDGAEHRLARPRPTLDLTRDIRPLDGPLTSPGHLAIRPPAAADRDRLLAFTLAMLTADLLGTMEAAHAATVRHARTRVQFGVPIGTFQAVQQLAADGLVLVEAVRSAMWYAAWAVDAAAPDAALRAARTAKSFASRSAVEVCENALQVLGGIGFTWESPAHRWLRRAHGSRRVFGDEHHHEAVLAAAAFGER